MTSSNFPFLNSVGPPTLSSPANPSSFQKETPRSEQEESRMAGLRFPGTEEYRMTSRLVVLLYTRLAARLTRLTHKLLLSWSNLRVTSSMYLRPIDTKLFPSRTCELSTSGYWSLLSLFLLHFWLLQTSRWWIWSILVSNSRVELNIYTEYLATAKFSCKQNNRA